MKTHKNLIKTLIFAIVMIGGTQIASARNMFLPTYDTSAVMFNSAKTQDIDLDFTIVNKTGYAIKNLYIGATGTGEWTKEDEVLNGRKFPNGSAYDIEFSPRETATRWDIKVDWADGSGGVEWLNLKLTEIEKVTLIYDADTDKTSAIIE